MASESQLKGFNSLGQYSYTENLQKNLVMFFDWGFINKGGFNNIQIPTSGAYGGDYSKLRPVNDARYTNGQVWESARLNWVWESGLETSVKPISISGIFVNNVFNPSSGTNYYIDYPNGRIVFNSAISQNSTVRVAHTTKWINVCPANSVPWLRKTQTNSFRVDNNNFLSGSGDYISYAETRLQLPTVAVEIAGTNYKGAALGGSQYCYSKAKFYIIAEDNSTVDRIADVIASQNEKTLFLFDSNRMATENRFPLDYRGSIASGALTYQQLVSYSGNGGYRQLEGILAGKMSLNDGIMQPTQNLTSDIVQRVITFDTEAILTKI